MKNKICPGKPVFVEWEKYRGEFTHWDAFFGYRPEHVKRKRLKCPLCGRRVLSSVTLESDAEYVIHTLPPHKVKGWWKKKHKKRK